MPQRQVGSSGATQVPNRLLHPKEAAALLGIDRRTLTRAAQRGRIKAVRTPGGHRRYYEADVAALKEACA